MTARLSLIVSIRRPIMRSVMLSMSFCLAACTGPVALYHDSEGGAIAGPRQAPPGIDAPYGNLADVPPAFSPAAPGAQAAIEAQARNLGGVSPANPAALEGLDLPTAAPPLPAGLHIPQAPPVPLAPPPAPAPPRRPSAEVPLAFPPNNAVLPVADNSKLAEIAAHRGTAHIIAGGFGDSVSLGLALRRAQRVAAALTARGVPPRDIRIVASAEGSGGFVQLVY